jgi:hypothetical protein
MGAIIGGSIITHRDNALSQEPTTKKGEGKRATPIQSPNKHPIKDAAAPQQIFTQISAQGETPCPEPLSGHAIGTFPDSPIILVW